MVRAALVADRLLNHQDLAAVVSLNKINIYINEVFLIVYANYNIIVITIVTSAIVKFKIRIN